MPSQEPHFLNSVKMPNFFILGAAKSGTSSLHHYLNQHPEVYLSDPKEPTFFCEDFQVVNNPISYFELFDNATSQQVIGEASHAYLSDPKSARVLKALFPKAKFVIILRNPADRAHSLYHHMHRFRFEKNSTFELALAAEESRFASSDFKANNPQSFYNFMYLRSGLYGEQIERYFHYFERSQFHILTLDQLQSDFSNTIGKIFNFLNLKNDIVIDPVVVNKGYAVKSDLIAKVMQTWLAKKLRISKLTTVYLSRKGTPEINPETRARLMHAFSEDQQRLHELCGVRFDA